MPLAVLFKAGALHQDGKFKRPVECLHLIEADQRTSNQATEFKVRYDRTRTFR